MLAKLPEQQIKSRTSDMNNNVNTKLAGLSVVLIIMLGVTGGYILLPLLSNTQPANIATNLAYNNTTTYTPASATHSKVQNNTKLAKNKTTTSTNTVKVNNTPKTVKTSSYSKANNT